MKYYDFTSLILGCKCGKLTAAYYARKEFLFLWILFIYSWDTQREGQRHRQREKQAPHREPDVGLDPRNPGSWPELKADTQPLSHPGVLRFFILFFKGFYLFIHEKHREKGRDTGRERSRLHAGSPMQDSIPGPRGHALSRRQTLNPWATQVSLRFLLNPCKLEML